MPMGKSKQPRKRKAPSQPEPLQATPEPVPPIVPRAELVPLPPPRLPETAAPVLLQVLEALRAAAGAMIDIADAAADALKKQLAGRA